MEHKDDWQDAQERLKAWWDGEIIDRPVIQIVSLREGLQPAQWFIDKVQKAVYFSEDQAQESEGWNDSEFSVPLNEMKQPKNWFRKLRDRCG